MAQHQYKKTDASKVGIKKMDISCWKDEKQMKVHYETLVVFHKMLVAVCTMQNIHILPSPLKPNPYYNRSTNGFFLIAHHGVLSRLVTPFGVLSLRNGLGSEQKRASEKIMSSCSLIDARQSLVTMDFLMSNEQVYDQIVGIPNLMMGASVTGQSIFRIDKIGQLQLPQADMMYFRTVGDGQEYYKSSMEMWTKLHDEKSVVEKTD